MVKKGNYERRDKNMNVNENTNTNTGSVSNANMAANGNQNGNRPVNHRQARENAQRPRVSFQSGRENTQRPRENSQFRNFHTPHRHVGRTKSEETVEDIKTDIQRIEKEIELEIKEIRSLKL